MYHFRFWMWMVVVYFALHVVFGYLHCARNFCAGDVEREWIYEVKIDGQWYVHYEGKYYTKAEWKKLVQSSTFE